MTVGLCNGKIIFFLANSLQTTPFFIPFGQCYRAKFRCELIRVGIPSKVGGFVGSFMRVRCVLVQCRRHLHSARESRQPRSVRLLSSFGTAVNYSFAISLSNEGALAKFVYCDKNQLSSN